MGTRLSWRRCVEGYGRVVRWLVLGLLSVSGLGIVVMMGITCMDVLLRVFNRPIPGTFDIVELSCAVTIACALPYTTAVKGHVAVEYFFHRLGPRGRMAVDTVARTIAMALFAVLSWRCFCYGESLRASGTGTLTLEIPTFWVLYVIGFSCDVVGLVILHNLLHPGKEMIKP